MLEVIEKGRKKNTPKGKKSSKN